MLECLKRRSFSGLGVSCLVGLALPLQSCNAPGDARVPYTAQGVDPCSSEAADLSEGIQTGDDLVAIFACLNRDGSFDAFVPTLNALHAGSTYAGDELLLDMWIRVINEELQAAEGLEISLQVEDLVRLLGDLETTLEEPWIDTTLGLAGSALEQGALSPAIGLVSNISYELVKRQPADTYDSYLERLIMLLCPNYAEDVQCRGDVVELYAAMSKLSAQYGTPDYVLPPPDALVRLLYGLLAPGGTSASSNERADLALGRGLARLGEGEFLLDTLGTWVPDLYGDDELTPELEGYESYNFNQSGLYALMYGLTDEAFFEEVRGMLNALTPLLNRYYVYSLAEGNSTAAKPVTCSRPVKSYYSSATDFQNDNPAGFGFAQILRLLKAANVSYLDSPLCASAFAPTVEAAGLVVELSGTTNIAALLLEIFAQVPVDVVIDLTDLSNVNQTLIDLSFNNLCGTRVLADDLEALQKSVHMQEVIVPTLKMLSFMNHAARPGGIGGMETLKDLLIGLYDSQMLCDGQPWLELALRENNVLVDSVDYLKPFLPGQPHHEDVTVPLLRLLAGLRGDPARTLIPPLANGLSVSGEDLGSLLLALGNMALDARTLEQSGKEAALYELNALLAQLAGYDPNYQAIDGMVAGIEEKVLMTAMLETLGNPGVRNALRQEGPNGQTAEQFLSEFINSGKLEQLLVLARGLLGELNASLQPESSP